MSTVILCRKCQCLKGLENIDKFHLNDWCAILFFDVMNNFDKMLKLFSRYCNIAKHL